MIACDAVTQCAEQLPRSGAASFGFDRHDPRHGISVPLDNERVSAVAHSGEDISEIAGEVGGSNSMFRNPGLQELCVCVVGGCTPSNEGPEAVNAVGALDCKSTSCRLIRA